MPEMNIIVRDKIATKTDTVNYVCGNSDYVVNFDFDSEWDAYDTKTAQFNVNGKHIPVVFTGNQCKVPVITNTYAFHVGVFAGDLHTTTAARVPCKKSILCDSGAPDDPPDDVYNQLMEKLNGKLGKNQGANNAGKAMVVDAEGNVVPGEAQGSSLPAMSADTKGKLLTNDGEKAEWTEQDDWSRLVVTIKVDEKTGDNTWSCTADKTVGEIMSAVEGGRSVVAVSGFFDGASIPLVNTIGYILFQGVSPNMYPSGITNIVMFSGNSATMESIPFNDHDAIHTFAETLNAAKQAQARENIGLTPVAKTDEMTQSVGLDAETGKLYTTPAEVFYIDLEGSYPDYICPVAMADIKAAYAAGKELKCRCAMSSTYTAVLPLFMPLPSANTWVFSGSGALTAMGFPAQSLTVAIVNGTVQASNTRLATASAIPSIPDALPNPKALTITIGYNVVSYDGSAARSVTIPTGGSSGGETWELINTFEIAEADAARVIKIDKDSNGNAFSLKEFAFRAVTNSTKTDGSVYGWFCVNGKGTYNSGLAGFQTNYVRHPSSGAAIVNDVIGRVLPFGLVYDHSTGRKAVEGIVATSVTEVHEVELAGYQYAENQLYGTFQLWGVRA